MQHTSNPYILMSPNHQLSLSVSFDTERWWYELRRNNQIVVRRSHLAIYGHDDHNFIAPPSTPVSHTTSSFDQTWEQPWGQQRYVRNNHNELLIEAGTYRLRFRLFDDGLGWRYELGGEGEAVIVREATEFNLPLDASAWWIPALGQNHYEHLYNKTLLSEIAAAHTPLTVELDDTTYIAIHEAALYEYGAMNLRPNGEGLTSTITPLVDGSTAKVTLPFLVPWRTIVVAEKAHELTKSHLMLNLNEPSKIADTSWIRPTKFMGIWWGMFLGTMTWATGKKHGATTANAFRYINAAKRLGITALLIEGWNEGWDGDWIKNGHKMNLMQPAHDFDIHAVTSYAASQGVSIVGHHETSGNFQHYEWQLPEAYDYYKHYGVNYIKTGYVQGKLSTGDFHSSQTGVRHFQKTVEMTAERQIMVNIHEPVKGTGTERTWPNLMTREGVMGQEYEGGAITPEHATVLPFTRLLSGPLDYTPGLFGLTTEQRPVSSTLAKQLALYVTLFSPMQMVADLPENYLDHPAFEFIRNVPVSWDAMVPLDGVIGDFFVIARKDRDSEDWYIGAVTDENEREVEVNFDFLPPHSHFTVTLYRDAHDADWQSNPEAYEIEQFEVTHTSRRSIRLAPGGGFGARLIPEGYTPLPYPEMQ